MAKRVAPTSAAAVPDTARQSGVLDYILEKVDQLELQGETIVAALDALKQALDVLKTEVGQVLDLVQQQAADQAEIDQLTQEVSDLTAQLQQASGGGQQQPGQGGGQQQPGQGGGQQQPGQGGGQQQPAARPQQPAARPQQPAARPGGGRIGGT